MNDQALKNIDQEVYEHFINAYEEIKNKDPKLAEYFYESKYSIYYSHPLISLKPGDVYFIGLNPAGRPSDGAYDIVDFKHILNNNRCNWNAYYCDDWGTGNPGDAKLQKRAKNLLAYVLGILGPNKEIVDENIRKIFCTNISFFRSENSKVLKKYGKDHYDCWRWHEKFLTEVKPKLILCIGNSETFSSYSYLKGKYAIAKDKKTSSWYRGACIKFFTFRPPWLSDHHDSKLQKCLAIGVPHMSRFSPDLITRNSDNKTFKEELREVLENFLYNRTEE